MTDSDRIHTFLRRARERALLENGVRTGAQAAGVLVVALFALALAAAMRGPAASWPYVAVGAIVACVAGGVALGYLRPARAYAEPVTMARLVGRRHPTLASDLLSAVELEAAARGEAQASPDLTQAFYATVADATAPLLVDRLFPLDRAVRAVSVAAILLLALLASLLASPTLMGRGLRTLFRTPTLFEGAQVAREPLVGDVRVTYDFPAYTGLPRQILEGSTGELRAVRGTRVQLEMRPLRSARLARLLLGDGGEAGTVEATVERGRVQATLALADSGTYRVWLQPFFGRPLREERAHQIVVESDEPPEVDITGPSDRVELAAPRPIEVAYHARDDYGLGEIALVYRIGGGPEQRQPLKQAQGAREVRGSTTFEPASAMLTPGAQVAYHIEARDRDEISGSKVGVSRTLYLVIQNPRGALEEHLAREHEVLEGMITSLAERIDLEHAAASAAAAERVLRQREVHDAEQARVADLGRLVDQQRRAGGASKVAASPLGAVAAHLGKLLREEGELLAGSAGKSDAATAALAARLHATAPRHTAELEGAVLALDDLIGRQRLDDLAAIGKDLVAAQQRLVELLERYQASGDEQLRRQIEREARELRARIAELARKIAEVKARNEVSPEFMNLPDPRQALETAARFDDLLGKGDPRSLGEALGELGKELASLRDLLDKNANSFGDTRFPQESRALAELSRKLSDLEGDQRGLADESRGVAKEVDGELARRMEAQQAELQAKARQKLEQIQRKLAGPVPRELGNPAETATEAARENVRQLRRLLPAKEWNEAQHEAEQLADGLGHLQHLVGRQRAFRRLSSPAVESFDGQVDDAAGLARELALDLSRVVPRGADVMSPEQRSHARNLAERQGSIEERTRALARDVAGRDDTAPGAHRAAGQLEEIAGQMRQTGQDLQDGAAHEGAGRASEVADRLAELRKSMNGKPSDGGRSSREPVRIPDADAYQAPREWRQELMEAMREKAPEKYREQVRHYYEELVR
jgi:hypothetical protein